MTLGTKDRYEFLKHRHPDICNECNAIKQTMSIHAGIESRQSTKTDIMSESHFTTQLGADICSVGAMTNVECKNFIDSKITSSHWDVNCVLIYNHEPGYTTKLENVPYHNEPGWAALHYMYGTIRVEDKCNELPFIYLPRNFDCAFSDHSQTYTPLNESADDQLIFGEWTLRDDDITQEHIERLVSAFALIRKKLRGH